MKDDRIRSTRRILAALATLMLCACASEFDPPSSDGGVDSGVVDAGAPGKPDAGHPDAKVCPPAMEYGGGEQTIVPGPVTATLVDETGASVAQGQPLYICGIDICVSPRLVDVGGAASIATALSVKKPAFKFGDGINYAEFGIPLTTSASNFRLMGTGKLATGKLADKPSAPLAPGTEVTSGDVALSIAADADVLINDLIYDTPEKQLFRAVNIPLTNAGALLPTEPNDFALLYGVGPAETTICPPAQVTVKLPESLGWAPGAPVEFWVTTTDIAQTYAPYAGWALMSEGAVSEDGKTVVTAAGQGFRVLEHFAIRLKR